MYTSSVTPSYSDAVEVADAVRVRVRRRARTGPDAEERDRVHRVVERPQAVQRHQVPDQVVEHDRLAGLRVLREHVDEALLLLRVVRRRQERQRVVRRQQVLAVELEAVERRAVGAVAPDVDELDAHRAREQTTSARHLSEVAVRVRHREKGDVHRAIVELRVDQAGWRDSDRQPWPRRPSRGR
jgi:hypothetical protein